MLMSEIIKCNSGGDAMLSDYLAAGLLLIARLA